MSSQDQSQHPARSSADVTRSPGLQVVVFGPTNSGKTAVATAILQAMRDNGVSASHGDPNFAELNPAQRQNDIQVKKPAVTVFEMADNQVLHTLVDEFSQAARTMAGIGDADSKQALKRELNRMRALLDEMGSWDAVQ